MMQPCWRHWAETFSYYWCSSWILQWIHKPMIPEFKKGLTIWQLNKPTMSTLISNVKELMTPSNSTKLWLNWRHGSSPQTIILTTYFISKLPTPLHKHKTSGAITPLRSGVLETPATSPWSLNTEIAGKCQKTATRSREFFCRAKATMTRKSRTPWRGCAELCS